MDSLFVMLNDPLWCKLKVRSCVRFMHSNSNQHRCYQNIFNDYKLRNDRVMIKKMPLICDTMSNKHNHVLVRLNTVLKVSDCFKQNS